MYVWFDVYKFVPERCRTEMCLDSSGRRNVGWNTQDYGYTILL